MQPDIAAPRFWQPATLTYPEALPVSAHHEEIATAIRTHQAVIVCGATGSGKTTQLPKICLEAGRGVAGRIACTQPRRIAARTVAARVAQELGTQLGEGVGYKVRFTDQVRNDTVIKVLTDGMLLAETSGDRDLRAYDTIIIDEAHERSLNIDFLLGYLRQLMARRPELKVIITSATIDAERFSGHFGGAPVIEVSGRTYPVEIRYRPIEAPERAADAAKARDTDEERQTQAILDATDELARLGEGDILIFLPGEREIRDVAEALRKHHPPHTEILPLFARLSVQEQQRIFHPGNARRIVLATNVAETSLTVPGIRYVIDPGLVRAAALFAAHQGGSAAGRAGVAGFRQPARRALRPGRGRGVHPAVFGTRVQRAPGVYRPGNPAHFAGRRDPAHVRIAPGRSGGFPVSGCTRAAPDCRWLPVAGRAQRRH